MVLSADVICDLDYPLWPSDITNPKRLGCGPEFRAVLGGLFFVIAAPGMSTKIITIKPMLKIGGVWVPVESLKSCAGSVGGARSMMVPPGIIRFYAQVLAADTGTVLGADVWLTRILPRDTEVL